MPAPQIGVGSALNDHNGDPLRIAFQLINTVFNQYFPRYDISGIDCVTLAIGIESIGSSNSLYAVLTCDLAAGGTGYAPGDILEIVGGTAFSPTLIEVNSVGGGGNITDFSIADVGSYSSVPANPAASQPHNSSTGTGVTFTVGWQILLGPAASTVIDDRGDAAKILLPSTPSSGQIITIKNLIDAPLLIDGNGRSIDGSGTYTLPGQYSSAILQYWAGSGVWIILNIKY